MHTLCTFKQITYLILKNELRINSFLKYIRINRNLLYFNPKK